MPEISIYDQPRRPELTSTDVARLLCITAPTVRALWIRGELEGWLIAGRVRFSRQAVADYLQRISRPVAA